MKINRHILHAFCFLAFLMVAQSLHAQLGFDLDIKKPEPYDNRELKAEKTGDKKLKAHKRFLQNMTTHYNYFFNANTKLNEIIDRAKSAQKEDYASLLPFYNYSLDVTAADSALLDSVIAKSKTAIVLHDLRNDWVDNMYMLWGASYYLKQQYDSAYQMFQFINYAFAEKEKDGFYRYIGSSMDGNKATSIATEENRSLPKKILSEPPSRNDAFIWQVRTMIQQGAIPEAGSLIATLKNDPVFPERLKGALEEVQAYWFYKQKIWDSSAHHLINALGEAKTKQERARWEYLAAQLFERSNLFEQAKDYYTKSIGHTTDPVMDIYARLNLIRSNKEGEENEAIDRNIADLIKMAKKDKYEEYRDAIYSMAAQMELERGNFCKAQEYLMMASKYKTEDVQASNRAYLQLADLSYDRHDYKNAVSFYDSIKIENLPTADAERISERREILSGIVAHINIVERQDSLQRIALLPENERTDYIKRLVRQMRRQQGLKEEDVVKTSKKPGEIPDPFTSDQKKGEWYFYNKTLKSSGAATFKQVWGTRPNVDNWRRFSDVAAELRKNELINSGRPVDTALFADAEGPISYDVFLARLPLTPEALKVSNDSIKRSLISLIGMYLNELEDYQSVTETYEELRRRFPEMPSAEVVGQAYYSYNKLGNAAKAAELKKLLLENYPSQRETIIVATGKDPQSTQPSEEVTKTYENIYDLFIEGRFEEAKIAKQFADSLYQTNYWSPQLLYIEAVYHVRQREDSVAKNILNTLIQQNGQTPLTAKAQTLINVLDRREEIESELTALQIERPLEDTLYVEPMPVAPTVQRSDTSIIQKDTVAKVQVKAKPVTDTAFKMPAPVKSVSGFTFRADAPHYAVVILNKVDPVFINEGRNAFDRYNKEKFYNIPLEVKKFTVNDDIKLLIIGNFANAQAAIDYVQRTKPIAGAQIVPWLKGDKFTFSIVTEENLQIITDTKDHGAYQKFLDQNLPVKF
jgi:hypothetical protein